MPQIHKRTCHLCEANCGLTLEVEGRRILSVKGNPDHVLSRGYICPKATAIPDVQEDPDRLRRPVKRVGGAWREVGFDEAIADIAERTAEIAAGPQRAALYVGNPTAHNYAVTLGIRGFVKALGSKGIYSASTLDQLPHMVAYKLMYGHSALYPVADIDQTRFMLILGGNPLASNGSLWTVPDVRGRIKALQKRGGKLVVVDPRRTETAKLADQHHFIRPGSDPAFLIALLLAVDEAGLVKPGRLEPMLDEGWAAAWAALRRFDLETLSAHCGVDVAAIRSIAQELGGGEPAIVYGRMGVSVHRFGVLNHWLIQLLNIATGNLDRPGGTPFGSPAVDMTKKGGGGGIGRYKSRVSGRPEVLGELPTAELAADIATPGDGQIGALFTVAGNPVLSSPGGRQLDAALEGLKLMVSVDMYVNETTRHADYILPPCGPLEKDHYPLLLAPFAVRNFTCYSPALFEKEEGALDDWQIVEALAAAIGEARGEPVAAGPHPRAALDHLLGQSEYGLTLKAVEEAVDGVDLGPLKSTLPEKLHGDDKRIACAPPDCLTELERFRADIGGEAGRGPRFVVIGRRHIRSNNSWLHNSHRLVKGPDRCTLLLNPSDAGALNLSDGDLAKVSNHVGEVELPVEISEDIMPGVVSIPHGWGHGREGVRLSIAAERPGASLNDLTDPQVLEPLSGNAVLNGVPVSVVAA